MIFFRKTAPVLIVASILISTSSPCQAQERQEQIGSWRITSYIEPVKGRTMTTATVWADGGRTRGALIFSCHPSLDGINVHYRTEQYMGAILRDGFMRPVTYQIDKQIPMSESWRLSEMSVEIHDRKQAEHMAYRVMGAQKIYMQALTFRFDTIQRAFTVEGATTALSRVIADCGGPLY